MSGPLPPGAIRPAAVALHGILLLPALDPLPLIPSLITASGPFCRFVFPPGMAIFRMHAPVSGLILAMITPLLSCFDDLFGSKHAVSRTAWIWN